MTDKVTIQREALLPCPFCGGEPEADTSYQVGIYYGCHACGVWMIGAAMWNRRAALAQQAEPVAYVLQSTHDASIMFDKIAVCGWHNFEKKLDELKADAWVSKGRADIVPLYAAPPASAAVPTGYVLVPIEPTQAMLRAAGQCIVPEGQEWLYEDCRVTWSAMIAAAGDKP